MSIPSDDLRAGTRVRYSPAHSDEWRVGVLVHASPNGEEWLVRSRFGDFWMNLARLFPAAGGEIVGH